MVDFHDVRLPEDIERGALGGPEFFTTGHTKASGHRVANIEWDQPLGGWDIGYGIQTLASLQAVRDFWYARRGSAYAFRFKDWSDFTLARQSIGTGDGATLAFQTYKRYEPAGPLPFDRIIQLLVSGTVQVWVNNVLMTEGVDYTVGYTTGIVTFTLAPGAGQNVEVACQFDVPVAFEKDRLNIDVDSFLNGSIPKIPVRIERL